MLLLVWALQLFVLEAHELYTDRKLWLCDPLNRCAPDHDLSLSLSLSLFLRRPKTYDT